MCKQHWHLRRVVNQHGIESRHSNNYTVRKGEGTVLSSQRGGFWRGWGNGGAASFARLRTDSACRGHIPKEAL
jgi:hypothetical protein